MITVIDCDTTFKLTSEFEGLQEGTFIPKDESNYFYRKLIEAIDSGKIEIVPYIEQVPIPTSITRFQALAVLASMGLLATVRTMVSNSDNEVMKLAFDNALEFKRTSPMLLELAGQLNLSASDLDTLFINASKIEV